MRRVLPIRRQAYHGTRTLVPGDYQCGLGTSRNDAALVWRGTADGSHVDRVCLSVLPGQVSSRMAGLPRGRGVVPYLTRRLTGRDQGPEVGVGAPGATSVAPALASVPVAGPPRIPATTNAVVVVPVGWIVPVAVRYPNVPGIVVPGPATKNESGPAPSKSSLTQNLGAQLPGVTVRGVGNPGAYPQGDVTQAQLSRLIGLRHGF